MKPKSNRFWLRLLGILVIVLAAVTIYLYTREVPGDTAVLTLDGEIVDEVDLTKVTENYTKEYTGKSGITNTVEFAPGKVRVLSADCPDKVCVYQSWIEAGGFPIACLPNSFLIQVISAEDVAELDGATG